MAKYITFLSILLLASITSWAVEPYQPVHPDPILETWRWRSFPELKGLGLACMAEDRDGNMWFGVTDGVRVYDGVNWTAYDVPGAPVSTLCATRDGQMYAGTQEGISQFQAGEWRSVFPTKENLEWRIRDLHEASDGSLWAATGVGALHLKKSDTTLYTSKALAPIFQALVPGVSISALPDGIPNIRPWPRGEGLGAMVGPRSEGPGGMIGLRGLIDSRVICYVLPGGPANIAGLQMGDRITAVNGDPEKSLDDLPGGIPITLTIQRPGRADLFDVAITPVEAIEGAYPSCHIADVYEDRAGDMWFGIGFWNSGVEGGVLHYDIQKSVWQMYAKTEGLNVGYNPKIIQTQDGNIWVGDESNGGRISRYDGKSWTAVTDSLRSINSFLETRDGTLWASTYGSVSIFKNGELSKYSRADVPLPSVRIEQMLESSDGAVWFVGRGHEAVRLDYDTSRWNTYDGLQFQCETPNNVKWFVSSDSSVVSTDGNTWQRYSIQDGLMDYPVAIIATQKDDLWATGIHEGAISVAQFDRGQWLRKTHVQATESVQNVIVHEATDGALWLGFIYVRALFRFDPAVTEEKAWSHHTPRAVRAGSPYGIGQTADGTIWAGNRGLSRFDGNTWKDLAEPEELSGQRVDAVYTTPDGQLWVGTRAYGVFHYNGNTWTQYSEDNGLAGNNVQGIYQTRDKSIWVGTTNGISRFDGQAWITRALPLPSNIDLVQHAPTFRESADGALWVNAHRKTIRYEADVDPPETQIDVTLDRVSQPGNTILSWTGSDPWKATPNPELQYAYRLNNEPWSPFTFETNKIFLSLPSGEHAFQVKSRDRDLNEDPSPATMAFTVIPPVWQQGWFIGMIGLFVGGIGFQTLRVIRRDRRLREANEAMSSANKELFQVNVDLQREQVLERLRGQAQGMQSSEDIKPVVEAVYQELSGLGLSLTTSAISITISETESETEYESWTTDQEGHALEPVILERSLANSVSKARLRGNDYYHRYREGEEVKENFRQRIEEGYPQWKDVPEDRWPQKHNGYYVFFEGGSVYVSSEEPIAEEYLMLIKRFGEVFGFAHSRYKELQQKEAQNRRLAVDASVQRLRAEVQSMDEASDFEHILSLLTEGLKTIELTFDGCEIDVLDEPVENPTMAHFEANGFRYTTFRMDLDGRVATRSYHLAAPFPTVIEQTIQRFIAGEPWQGTSEGDAIVEVPAGAYGRLRLTATDRQNFTENEVATLREFADAVALGYARYLDIREIQEQTQRKSAFLASMSHELRTPMNAIKGFTNLVLRREKELSDRNRGNLEKVTQASDHLLAMINDLLDLSKIEAGRMDVNVSSFDVGHLVEYCVSTVSPLVHEGVTLSAEVDEGIGQAHTDEARLRQMLINLASNAIKFTDSGRVTVKARQADGHLELSVSDTGKGIPQDELLTIFDEYRQVKGSDREHKGTGLGLSITKQFAELLGGSVGVESEEGKGSTFIVKIPVQYEGTS